MFKKLTKIAALIGLIIIPKAAFSMVRTYGGDMLNDATLAYSTAPVLNLDDIDTLAMQATYSSATVNSQTFRDGAVSTGSITISSNTALSTAAATDSITLSSNTALSGKYASVTVYISSNPILISTTFAPVIFQINGSSATLGANWVSTVFATATALNLATTVNNLGVYGISATTGPVSGSSVTITATVLGSAFNSMRVVSSTPTLLLIASTTLLGGRDPAVINLNGNKFFANKNFFVDAFTTNTLLNISNMMNFSSYSITAATSTVGASSAVTLTALAAGTIGNSYTLTVTTSAIGIASTTFNGGVNAAILKVNGVPFVNGLDWFTQLTTSRTAQNLSNALMANFTISSVIISSWSTAGVVYATSTAINHNEYSLQTSTQFALTISNVQSTETFQVANFTGGAPSNLSIQLFHSSSTIMISTHGITSGFPMWWQTLSGSTPTPLNVGTTYYVIRVDQNNIKLALTSTGALAGLNINISSQSLTGGSFFKLNPVGFAGTPSFKWQASNDNVSYFDLPISSVTFSSGVSSTMWDGTVNYRWLRFNYSAGTGGGMNIKVNGNGKKFQQ